MQYTGGTHRIASWAPIINAHIFPGPAIIQALRSAAYEAMASSNMIVTREITGGRSALVNGQEHGRRGQLFLDEESLSPGTRRGREDNDNDDHDEDDDEETAGEELDSDDEYYSGCISPGPHETVYGRPLTMDEMRRGSSIAIHTTISSTTEKVTCDVLGDASQFRGLLLLAQMSSADNLFTPEYTRRCVELARQYSNFVMGFIAQEGLNERTEDNFITMTPGVSLPPLIARETSPHHARRQSSILSPHRRASMQVNTQMSDGMGQRYNTPRNVILDKGVDVIIVGRGILRAEDMQAECERYRREGWEALCDRWGSTS
jgi:uridine monophosphate synthetase